MDVKVYLMLLLVGTLSALYHAGKPRDSNTASDPQAG